MGGGPLSPVQMFADLIIYCAAGVAVLAIVWVFCFMWKVFHGQ